MNNYPIELEVYSIDHSRVIHYSNVFIGYFPRQGEYFKIGDKYFLVDKCLIDAAQHGKSVTLIVTQVYHHITLQILRSAR